MSTLRKEVDFKEVLSKAGFSASVEEVHAPDSDPLTAPIQDPDLVALEKRFSDILVKGGEVSLALLPRTIRAASQFAHRSRLILRYMDAQPALGKPAVEVDAVIGPATDKNQKNLELVTLGKHTKSGLWIPDIDEADIEPLLHGLSAMPATDQHSLKNEVALVGRHGAGIIAAIDKTPAGAYLSSQGAKSITYGPDVLEDPQKNNGARGFWGAVSASPDNVNATVPGPGEVLPIINASQVEEIPNHWARGLKLVIRPEHLDPIALQAGRIIPRIVQPHPEISMGDLMLTRVAQNLGGVKQAIEKVQTAAEMTRLV